MQRVLSVVVVQREVKKRNDWNDGEVIDGQLTTYGNVGEVQSTVCKPEARSGQARAVEYSSTVPL